MTDRARQVAQAADGTRAPGGIDCQIAVDPGASLRGKLYEAPSRLPGLLVVHGWDSDQAHYQFRAEDVAALGCICMTFDMRGHGRQEALKATVTREDNLRDVLAALDLLAAHPKVNRQFLGIIGTSYCGYLAAIASVHRTLQWLALRVPALYPDAGWDVPKQSLDRGAMDAYRRKDLPPDANLALAACRNFKGDALLVASELDEIVPLPATRSYLKAFEGTSSLTYRRIAGADHALTDDRAQRTYDNLLSGWLTEMIVGARTPNES